MGRAVGTVRALVGVAVLIVSLVGGAFAVGIIGSPGVAGVENRFGAVNETTTIVETDVTVTNPNPIGIDLGGVTVNYTVDLNGVRLANGDKQGVAVSAGTSTLTLRTAMANERIPEWWVAHIRDGERSDLAVHATARSATLGRTVTFQPVDREISTDVLSAFHSTEPRPVNADRPLVSDPVLYVNETDAAWGSVTEAETPIEMTFVVYNPKSVPYAVTSIGYEITMNEVAVGSGETDEAHVIQPKSTRTIRATTAIDNPSLDEWWVSHLERNQVTELRIDFYARIELPGGQEVRVPLDELTYVETIETDVFGTKDDASGGSGSVTDGGADGDSSEADSTGDGDGSETTTEQPATGTPTETATATPTETRTTTDDGGLL